MELTQVQWDLVGPLIPKPRRRPDGRGRPRQDIRRVLDGILWVLRTGAPWKDMPERHPPYQTCHRYFQTWSRSGVFEDVLRALAADLAQRGGIDVEEAFIDGSFTAAKKGAARSGLPDAVKAPRSWQLQTALVFLSPCTLKALRRTR